MVVSFRGVRCAGYRGSPACGASSRCVLMESLAHTHLPPHSSRALTQTMGTLARTIPLQRAGRPIRPCLHAPSSQSCCVPIRSRSLGVERERERVPAHGWPEQESSGNLSACWDFRSRLIAKTAQGRMDVYPEPSRDMDRLAVSLKESIKTPTVDQFLILSSPERADEVKALGSGG